MFEKLVVAGIALSVAVTGCGRAALLPVSDDYTVIYQSSWRNGIDHRLGMQAPNATSITAVTLSQFSGTTLKVSIARSDDYRKVANGSPRAELSFGTVATFAMGMEYEVRWTTLIPPNTPFDTQQPEIISQLHQGVPSGSPPFALMLDSGQYRVDVWGGAGTSTRTFKFGVPQSGEGTVAHWTLVYRPDASGAAAVTDLFLDGTRVVHAPGVPNAYPNDTTAYWKMGIYKWWWLTRPSDVSERTMYFGDLTIRQRPVKR